MKEITTVILHNYKSHKHTEIPFDKLTALIGETDSGKTAILGGIRLCLENYPSGTDYIRHGESQCYAEVQFNNNTKIRRTRGDKENSYDLTFEDGKVLHLEGFGTGPVDEVVKFHGMRQVNFFGSKESLNICTQMSPPFFIGESAPTKALMIGKLGNTDVVDLAIKNTSSEIRQNKALVKEHKKRISEIKTSIGELKELPKMQKDLKIVANNIEKISKLCSVCEKIEDLSKNITNLTSRKGELEKVIHSEEDINNVIDSIIEIESKLKIMDSIVKINKAYLLASKQKHELEETINNIDTHILANTLESIDKALKNITEINTISSIKNKLIKSKEDAEELRKHAENPIDVDAIINNLDSCKTKISLLNDITTINDKLSFQKQRKSKGDKINKDLQDNYERSVSDYKRELVKSKKCPLCMSDITEEKADSIVEIF